MNDLTGKIVLVTGGSRGIGRAVALSLARAGAVVWINYVSRGDAAEQVVGEIEAAGGTARAILFDVADSDSVQNAVETIVGEDGTIDILVNNAGITRDGLMARMKEDDWDAVLATNLKGVFLCSKAVGRVMLKKRRGRVVNIGSVVGFTGNAGQANYAAAKAGLVGFTRAMALEYAARNVTVNCVAPGFIETEMTGALKEEIQDALRSRIPLGVFGRGEDVAAAVEYLVSDGARYVTGQTLHVNGGMYM